MASPAATGVHVHSAWRSDVLADALGDVLATPLADPFASEVISVPTAGVERWLAQTLAAKLGTSGTGDGVSAGIEFPPLRRLIGELVTVATGVDPDTDPWQPERLVWQVMAAMDAVRDEPWFAIVAEHLYRNTRPGRRFRTAQRLARLFGSYAEQRPQLLLDWSRGVDNVPEDLVWQPVLWRVVRDRLGVDPSQRLSEAVRRLIAEPELADLPPRLSVFGPTRLSVTEVTILEALGAHRSVHLWLPQPSPAAAQRVSADPLGQRTDAWVESGRHPLLNRLGRDSLELSRVLTQISTTHHHHDAPMGGSSLLQALQADVVADQPPRGDHRLAPSDASVQFHACHGPERQVEVLREIVLGVLADDPTLEPRDIVVMCPDIERWAPQISALFDGAEEGPAHHPVHRIPVRLADRSLRQVNPVLAVLEQLFDLGHERARASGLLALCAAAPIARRFKFSDDDLDTIAALIDRAQVRWGIDRADLDRHGMGRFTANTWLAGLDRLLVGIALPSDQPLIDIAPVDITSSSDVDLIGRLTELVTRLRRINADFAAVKPLSDWAVSMRTALELVTDVGPNDDWQIHHAFATIADLADAGEADGPELGSADVAELLADAFRGRPSRASFRTGALTVCTLSPMRSVPHRVVILLGLDDGAFPRSSRAVGDDLLARSPREGERDRATEDRQLLLDAVLSAGEKLVVIYSGRDPLSNRELPMAIPLADMAEACELTVDPADRDDWAQRHHQHPLQPFSPKNFEPAQPLSFDTRALGGARALLGPREPTPTLIDVRATLPALPTDSVELTDLISMFTDPLRHFLKARGLPVFTNEVDPYREEISSQLTVLSAWALKDRVLRELSRGVEPDAIIAKEARSGRLPPFDVGRDTVHQAIQEMRALLRSAGVLEAANGTPYPLQIPLPDFLLTGAVAVTDHQQFLITPSKRNAKHHVTLWINHLALCASEPRGIWSSHCVSHPDSYRYSRFRFPPMGAAEARDLLSDLLHLYTMGLQRVLPLPSGLALDWMQHTSRSRFDPSNAWRFSGDWPQYYDGPEDLWERRPPEDSEFGELARRVYGPMLARQERP